jgi:hypothetical protein
VLKEFVMHRVLVIAALCASLFACKTASTVVDKSVDYAACRAIQGEAGTALRAVHAAQSSFASGRDAYADTLGELGVQPEEDTFHYSIKLVKVTKKTFLAEAKATDKELGGDTWTIDQKGKLENTKDGCKK